MVQYVPCGMLYLRGRDGVFDMTDHRMKKNNRGSAVVEASIGVALLLLLFLAMYHIIHIHAVRSVVYDAAVEAAEYAAEFAYLECVAEDVLTGEKKAGDKENDLTELLAGKAAILGAAEVRFLSALDEPELIRKYVVGGEAGLLLLESQIPDENGDICLVVNYTIRIAAPLFPEITVDVEERIRQKPYLGHKEGNDGVDDEAPDPYVYITDNAEVYHRSRGCTHLVLDVSFGTRERAVAAGLHACSYCGGNAGDLVCLCPEGEAYHSTLSCRGLKRTVYRKRLSEVAGLPPCSRCGR